MPIFKDCPELLSRFRAGEPRALVAVYEEYAAPVQDLVGRRCQIVRANGRINGILFVSAQDFPDVVHEVFVRAFSPPSRRGYDGVRAYGPYLLMIARNTMIDWARRRGQAATVAECSADIASLAPRPDDPAPWTAPHTLAILDRYLAALPDELRRLHRLRYERALSQEASAREMGISRQKLRTLEQRLRRGLAEELSAVNPRTPAAAQP
jgi:RNA polymerase sigma factor (sigma-70 family)